ncbi:AraC family transcriptional regulator [Spirosoma utsteinense]|uniref:AraC-like DNA-binding protein/quercetin dioxygenase-like cupin family protein n=1 Tax=Spirosoma utsteinense TaxID=2585773 RepID=A0ABR6W282_9BACT|nr:AraC family transcriptional regulator [Spirosoma utsteinense]MBC3788122.1 AraC-like DNA-binding protein/quercetin dioxygenase-like cupin family protein [Spirosoma utsteinense]MBC3790017.1 AraC-like DNA-binding protein/quercetin dioxygenase-like cupin family protein [Spirosoma utsteinense]
MKLQFEKIEPEAGSSFKVVHDTNAKSCWVYWHYHPEYEIVYIPFGTGQRRVGTNVSSYEEGELVFIGPNLPHLNFSYGKEGQFEEIVVQMRDDFLGGSFFQAPELANVRRLFERAHMGLTFGIETKHRVGPWLSQMPGQVPFERMLTLLRVLEALSTAHDAHPLHADGVQFDLNPKEQERFNRVCQYVEQHYAEPVNVRAVADLASLTVPAFCRYFKRMTHLTFTDFVNEYRVNQARRLLHSARTVADVSADVGFNNLSHFNKTFRAVTGQTPSTYRKALVGH